MSAHFSRIGSIHLDGRGLAVAVWLAASAASHADEPIPRLAPADLAAVTAAIDAAPEVNRLFPSCPADAWRRRADMTGVKDVAQTFCAREPKACLAQCIEVASGEYCLTLAQILQADHSIDPVYGEKLYLMACSSGQRSGCTNRAASIRNRAYPHDPFNARSANEKAACEHKTFAISCKAGDAWGCAMLGQSFANGEGTPVDRGEAIRAFGKSCAIRRDFPACRFAKDAMDELLEK